MVKNKRIKHATRNSTVVSPREYPKKVSLDGPATKNEIRYDNGTARSKKKDKRKERFDVGISTDLDFSRQTRYMTSAMRVAVKNSKLLPNWTETSVLGTKKMGNRNTRTRMIPIDIF